MTNLSLVRRAAMLLVLVALASACYQTTPVRPTQSKVLFGIGTEASDAANTRIVREAPVHMLTSWYNGPNDLSWMTSFRNNVVPNAYAAGRSLHLVVWTGDQEHDFPTKYGTACGREYPLSDRFLNDMTALAKTFAGTENGPALYVTLFTEFETYPCSDNAWNPDAKTNNYYRALKDRYLETAAVFHHNAPNAHVSIGWGGWQYRWDDAKVGGGKSMIAHFADVMKASDFQSFQLMNSGSAPADARAMTEILGKYGAVMLAHYDPSDQGAFDRDVRGLFTDASVSQLTQDGLFAFSFMKNDQLAASESTYQFVKGAVQRYGR